MYLHEFNDSLIVFGEYMKGKSPYSNATVMSAMAVRHSTAQMSGMALAVGTCKEGLLWACSGPKVYSMLAVTGKYCTL